MGFRCYKLVTALCLLVCSSEQSLARRRQTEQIPSEDRFNFFDLELIQSIAQSVEGNVVVSPVSVKATLAMLLEGAGGTTAAQLRTALRLPEDQPGVQRVIYTYLTSLMTEDPGYKLNLANRVFMSHALSPNLTYAAVLRANYYADLESIDFRYQKKAAYSINSWVRRVTQGLIPELVTPGSLQPDALVMVANAVYFKGKWKLPFDSSGTVPRCFYALPKQCQEANMMESLTYYNYAYLTSLDAYALELPYEGDRFSMVIVMPKSLDGITQLLRDIAHERMHNIISSLVTTEVLVSLPRFNVDFYSDLVPTLSSLGVKDMFTPQSNLTGLFSGAEGSAQVSNVFHKAKIIVNEEGSEAGAGTGALVIPLMGGTVIPKFRVDRPFLFFIRDTTTNVILFAGRVTNPDPVLPSLSENIDSVYGQGPTTTRTTHNRRTNNRHSTTERTTHTTEGTLPSYSQSPPNPHHNPNSQVPSPSYSQAVNSQNPTNSQAYNPPAQSPQTNYQNPSSQQNYNLQFPSLSSTTNHQQPAPVQQTYQQQTTSTRIPLVQPLSLNDHYNQNKYQGGRQPVQHSNTGSNHQNVNTHNVVRDTQYGSAQNTVREPSYTSDRETQNSNTRYTPKEPTYANTHVSDRETQNSNTRYTPKEPTYANTHVSDRETQNSNTRYTPKEPSYANTHTNDRETHNTNNRNTAREPSYANHDTQYTNTRNSERDTQPTNTRTYERDSQSINTGSVYPRQDPVQYSPTTERKVFQTSPSTYNADVHYVHAIQVPTHQYTPTNNNQHRESFQASGPQYEPAIESTYRRPVSKVAYQQPAIGNTDAIVFTNQQEGLRS